jgi:hypothetical protein
MEPTLYNGCPFLVTLGKSYTAMPSSLPYQQRTKIAIMFVLHVVQEAPMAAPGERTR